MQLIAMACGGLSTMNGSFPLARRLIAEGYAVTYLTAGPAWQPHIERQGFNVHCCVRRQSAGGMEQPRRGKLTTAGERLVAHLVKNEHLNSQVEEWIRQERPSLALIDANSLDPVPPYVKQRVPVMIISCTLSSYVSDCRPPVFSTTVPGRSNAVIERVSRAWQWRKLVVKQQLDGAMRSVALRAVSANAAIRPVKQQVEALGGVLDRSEYGWRLCAPGIVLAPSVLDWPMPSMDRARYYAGLCVDQDRDDAGCDLSVFDGKRNIIYLAMGSSSMHYPYVGRLLRSAYEAMAVLTDHHLIMQVGDAASMPTRLGVAPNVTYVQWAPQLEALKRSSLFISHGGLSSVREAILQETPMLAFPGWHDQYGNAARVEYFGLGLRGDMRTVTTESLLAMMRRAADNPSMKAALRQMRQKIAEADELSATVSAIGRTLEDAESRESRLAV